MEKERTNQIGKFTELLALKGNELGEIGQEAIKIALKNITKNKND